MLAEWVIGLFGLVASLVFFAISFSFPEVSADPGGLALLPRIAAVLTGVFSAGLLASLAMRGGSATAALQTVVRFFVNWRESSPEGFEVRRSTIVLALCALYPLIVLKVGFFLGSLVFSFVLVLFYRGTLVQATILSLVLATVLQMFFATLLGVYVPPGDWTSAVLEAVGL
jgi:hypothetical protein